MSETKARSDKGKTTLFRKRLETKRQEILSLYEHDLRIGQKSSDEGAEDLVDRANTAHHREFMLSLSNTERQIVFEIEEALQRLDGGSYGMCEPCGQQIPRRRLQAIPWAKYCIECQEKVEQGLVPDS